MNRLVIFSLIMVFFACTPKIQEAAYEPNGKELLYLNEQANKLVKKIQKKVLKLTKTK